MAPSVSSTDSSWSGQAAALSSGSSTFTPKYNSLSESNSAAEVRWFFGLQSRGPVARSQREYIGGHNLQLASRLAVPRINASSVVSSPLNREEWLG